MSQSAEPVLRRPGGRWAPLVLVAPFGVLFLVFMVAPIVWALRTSLFRERIIGGNSFVGLDNYRRAVHDGALWSGVGHVGALALLQIPLMVVLALAFALVLDGRAVRLRGLYRTLYFVPYAVPTVVGALVWGFIYEPKFGLLDQIAHHVGLGSPSFLSRSAILGALANIGVWSLTGYVMVILYTALKAVPVDLVEAAAIDGARSWRIVTRIKIPLIRSAVVLVTVLLIINVLQLFNEPQILSVIAPGAIGSHYTPNLYAYNVGFQDQDLSYSAALSFVLAGVIVAVSYGSMLLARRRSTA